MTGKTHISTGIAVATAISQPHNFKALAICITAATIGSIISDIDVTTSESHKDLVKILTVSIVAIAICSILEVAFHLGIISLILSQTNYSRMIIGALAFLLICSYGMHKPHRTFMHSLLCDLILSSTVFLILPSAVLPFATAMLSHIVLDLFNRRKVQIFFPHKKKIAFKLCPAQGKIDNTICKVCTALSLIEFGFFIAIFKYTL